jgi:hypothetical protein
MSVTSSKGSKGNIKSSGVADYFAILGVGDRLVCESGKHTQKEQ